MASRGASDSEIEQFSAEELAYIGEVDDLKPIAFLLTLLLGESTILVPLSIESH